MCMCPRIFSDRNYRLPLCEVRNHFFLFYSNLDNMYVCSRYVYILYNFAYVCILLTSCENYRRYLLELCAQACLVLPYGKGFSVVKENVYDGK